MTRNRPIYQFLLLLLTAVTAVYLLSLSWPRLRSSLAYVPVEAAIKNHWNSKPITTDRFVTLIESANRSLEILNDARYLQGLSLLYYLQYQYLVKSGAPDQDQIDALQRSLHATETTLARAPAKPGLWLRLARIRAWSGQTAQRVMDSLRMSIRVGRVEPRLLLGRVSLGVKILDRSDRNGETLVRDQIRLAWRLKQRDFIAALNAGSIKIGAIRGLLKNSDSEILEQMEKEAIPKRSGTGAGAFSARNPSFLVSPGSKHKIIPTRTS